MFLLLFSCLLVFVVASLGGTTDTKPQEATASTAPVIEAVEVTIDETDMTSPETGTFKAIEIKETVTRLPDNSVFIPDNSNFAYDPETGDRQ